MSSRNISMNGEGRRMEAYRRKRGADGRERVEVRLRGPQLLNHPMYNRSTAFTP